MTDTSPQQATKPVDQTPPLDPENEIHQRVQAMEELELHNRRIELRSKEDLNLDELTELCAVLARLRAKKAGPPSDAKTRKKLKDPSKQVDIRNLEL